MSYAVENVLIEKRDILLLVLFLGWGATRIKQNMKFGDKHILTDLDCRTIVMVWV